MKRTLLVIAMLLGTGTLPALAAMPSATSLPKAGPSAIEAVQYRHTPRRPQQGAHARRSQNGYDAYASHNGARTSQHHDALPGWPCESRIESSTYSAYPAWEFCN
jgi:hypothetical protein